MKKEYEYFVTILLISSVLMFVDGCSSKKDSLEKEERINDIEQVDKKEQENGYLYGYEGTFNKPLSWENPEGKEYKILKIGKLRFRPENSLMLTVRYLSKDPFDESIREKEFHEVYILVAKHLDLTGYDYVGLEAVDKPSPKFGITKISGHRDNKTVEEIIELAKSK